MPLIPSEKNEKELKKQYRNRLKSGSGGSSGSTLTVKTPSWYVKDVPQAERCECGLWNVTYELCQPNKELIRRCESCYQKLKKTFSGAVWNPAPLEGEFE